MLLYVAASMLVAVACHNEETTIKKTAYKYSYAMANYRVDDAEKYATTETRETTLVSARQMIGRIGDDYIASDTPAKIKIIDWALTSDTTAYAVYHKTTPIKDFADTLILKKREGRWQAHAPLPVIKTE